MKFKIILIVIIVLSYSCSSKDSIYLNNKTLELLASAYPRQVMDSGDTIPAKYSSFALYVKCNDEQVTETNMNSLIRLYDRSYKSVSFYRFLEQVLNQKVKVQFSEDFSCFNLNDKVTTEYQSLGYEKFVELYFLKTSFVNEYKLRSNVEDDKLRTIYYYCFLNGYLYSESDYGVTYIQKIEDYL